MKKIKLTLNMDSAIALSKFLERVLLPPNAVKIKVTAQELYEMEEIERLLLEILKLELDLRLDDDPPF